MSERELTIDVLIFGGGIAGLWTLARLRSAGYSCMLVERDALGAGQTIASQGIIHGGIKYALTGQASRASLAIAEMPGIWEKCLAGTGEIDLRAARVLSERQYLWTTSGIGARLVGVAARHMIRTAVNAVPTEARPECFAHAPKGVDVYAVEERVLDPRSVVLALAQLGRGCIVRSARVEQHRDGSGVELETPLGSVVVRPKHIVLAAGEGNAALLQSLGAGPEPSHVGQQTRPLYMVMVRGTLPPIFGHCVGMSDRPRLTITSQTDAQGRTVWYVGGEVAESGNGKSATDQIAAARREITACLPWVKLDGTQWAAMRVTRAEGTIGDGAKNQRPDEPVVSSERGLILAYPTKLAFAPLLAEKALELVRGSASITTNGVRGHGDQPLEGFEQPLIAALPWEREEVSWI